jgi:hypothetical protein
MLEYNSSTDLWKIVWESSNREEWIPRIYLLFLTEDPVNHAHRVKAAIQGRTDTEAKMVIRTMSNISVLRIVRGKYARRR